MCYGCFIMFIFHCSDIFYPKLLSRHYQGPWVIRENRINSSWALSPKLISRQRVGCIPVSSIPRIFRIVQPPKNPRGVVLTRALRKLSSSDDWYGFRSPYFAPPISTASNLSPSSLPTARKNDGFATPRRSISWLSRANFAVIAFLTKLSKSFIW